MLRICLRPVPYVVQTWFYPYHPRMGGTLWLLEHILLFEVSHERSRDTEPRCLAQNQDYFSHQNTPVFTYKAEFMWFECLCKLKNSGTPDSTHTDNFQVPDEAFPGQPPRA